MAADFLSSDIVFPSGSNEPKLCAATQLPEPIDWAFHDYYSTACEKAFTPIQSLTDLRKLEPCPVSSSSSKVDSLLVVLSSKAAAAPVRTEQQHLRAALRGALEIVENDMQDNHHLTRLSSIHKDNCAWKEELLNDFSRGGGDDDDLLLPADVVPSPAYDSIHENPVLLDSSSSSIISSSIRMHQDYFLPPVQEPKREDASSSIHSALPPPPPPPPLKHAFTKSKAWQNLVARLKKNLASPKRFFKMHRN